MRRMAAVLITSAVLLAVASPALAQDAGMVMGTFTLNGGVTGTFDGRYSGGPIGSFSGTTSLGGGSYSGPIEGNVFYSGSWHTFYGSYSGSGGSGTFSASGGPGAPGVGGSEPLSAMVVGLGLFAAGLLRRR